MLNELNKIKSVKLPGNNSDINSRSDTIMILSIDKQHDKLKLTSIMRDTYISVDGHGMTKITHAYAYGGPQLAVKTINQNFNMNIKDYVTVDFFGLEKIIDSIGGVQINVEKAEVPVMNSYITETSRIEKTVPTFVQSSGLQTLNGSQAVAYSRIRYVGNADYKRTQRQRTVLEQLRLPEDGYCKGQMINKIYYLVADLNAAKSQLYKFIYEEDMIK